MRDALVAAYANILFNNSNCSNNYGKEAIASISYFHRSGDDIESIKYQNTNSFDAFINSRTKYLESLKSLGSNWSSGTSKQPSEKSIEISKRILNNLNFWYRLKGANSFVYPQIIMGPLPTGGVSLEITINSEKKVLLNIYDSSLEMETEINGYYAEQDVSEDTISDSLTGLYDTNGIYGAHPGWRDAI